MKFFEKKKQCLLQSQHSSQGTEATFKIFLFVYFLLDWMTTFNNVFFSDSLFSAYAINIEQKFSVERYTKSKLWH